MRRRRRRQRVALEVGADAEIGAQLVRSSVLTRPGCGRRKIYRQCCYETSSIERMKQSALLCSVLAACGSGDSGADISGVYQVTEMRFSETDCNPQNAPAMPDLYFLLEPVEVSGQALYLHAICSFGNSACEARDPCRRSILRSTVGGRVDPATLSSRRHRPASFTLISGLRPRPVRARSRSRNATTPKRVPRAMTMKRGGAAQRCHALGPSAGSGRVSEGSRLI